MPTTTNSVFFDTDSPFFAVRTSAFWNGKEPEAIERDHLWLSTRAQFKRLVIEIA
jgi:hypothetical protein